MKKTTRTRKGNWFTLVELIVVITILAILGTIWFISFSQYNYYARDGVRVSDIKSIQSGLELFSLEKWFFPTPTWWINTTYSWEVLRTQWTFDDQLFKNTEKLNKKPTDPLTGREYAYSVLYNGQEYEMAASFESNNITLSPFISQVNAEFRYAIIKGNYNGRFFQKDISDKKFVFGTPSIMNISPITLDIRNIIQNKQIVINGWTNLPLSQDSSGTVQWNIDPEQVVVFSWTVNELNSNTWMILTIQNLQNIYTWTLLQWFPQIQEILKLDPINRSQESITVLSSIINWWVLANTNNFQGEWSSSSSSSWWPVSPSLSLNHTSSTKNFSFSWIPTESVWNCKLQYLKDGTDWTDVNGINYNCDLAITNQDVILPWNGWNTVSWNSIPVRLIKVSNSSILWTFWTTLNCSTSTWSLVATPTIDEDCDWVWDNYSNCKICNYWYSMPYMVYRYNRLNCINPVTQTWTGASYADRDWTYWSLNSCQSDYTNILSNTCEYINEYSWPPYWSTNIIPTWQCKLYWGSSCSKCWTSWNSTYK